MAASAGMEASHESSMVAPMTRLTSQDVPFEWGDACQKTFESVKPALVSAPVLAIPEFSNSFAVIEDVSGEGLGAVLE